MKKLSLLSACLSLSLLPVASRAADGSWSNDADGLWSGTGNWSGGNVATGTGARAFFTNAITAPRAVGNDLANNTIGHLQFGPAAGNAWSVTGQPLVLAVSAASPTVTVDAVSAELSARLAGTQGLAKAGAGELRLAGNHTLTGTALVQAGTLAVTGGAVNAAVALSAGTVLSAQMGQGLVGEYYYVGPVNVNNSNPVFTALLPFQSYFAALSPNLLFNGPSTGTNFDFLASGANFPPGMPTASVQTRWKGLFTAPAPGVYTFQTSSDDGSMLWIDGTNVVDNNVYQPVVTRTGTVELAAGDHEILIAFYQGGGGYGFYVDVAHPGGTTNRLPLASLRSGPAIASLSGAAGSLLDLGNAPLTVAQAVAADFNGTLSGANPLRKIGAGRLTLTADNSAFTGGFLLEGGTLAVQNDNNLGAAAAPITFFGGTLSITSATLTSIDSRNVNWGSLHGNFETPLTGQVFTVGAAIGGAGTVGKLGPGRLLLTGVNPHAGTLLVSSGVVDVATGASIESPLVQVNGGGLLVLQSSTALSTQAVVSLTTGAAGNGRLYLTNGVNQTVAALLLNTAMQKPGTYGATGSGATFVNDAYFGGAGLLTVTGGVAAAGGTDSSWGVNLSGDWGAASNWVAGQIAFGTNATAYFTNGISGDRTVNNGYAPLEIGNLVFKGVTNNHWFVTNGTMQLATTSGVAPTVTVLSNNATIGSTLQGAQGLTKSGVGQLILTGAGTYAGTTTVQQGTLQLTGNATLYNAGTSPGAIEVKNGGTLALNRSDVLGTHTSTPPVPLTIEAGGLVQNSGGVFNTLAAVTLNGGELRANGGANANFQAFQLKGTVTVGGASASVIGATRTINTNNHIQLGNNTANGTTELNVADVTGDAGADLVVSATLANGRDASGSNAVPSGFVKTGPGTLVLAGNSIHSGPSTLSAGAIVVSGGVVNAAMNLAAGTVLSAEYGSGLVGEYYFTGIGTNPLSASVNTPQHFANHLANVTPVLTAVHNGPHSSTNFDFTNGGWPANLFSNQYYEARYAGKFLAPTSGVYTFQTASDDGSMLWVDGTNVVNNNAFQGTTVRTGTIALATGPHDLVIAYYQGGGGFTLDARVALPGGTTNLLPLSLVQTPPAVAALTGPAGSTVNVSNAPLTLAQMTDSTFSGTLAGTNVVRKVGNGILTLAADNSAFPGVFELGGGRVAIDTMNRLPPQAVFNGGVLRIVGTGLTAPRSTGINWSTFIGGFDIADAANTFTVTNNIGSATALASLWKHGPGTLPLVGNSNSLNLGLNVMTGLVTMVQNFTAANGGFYIARGSLVLDNAYLQNVSNNADYVGSVAGDTAVLTIGGTSRFTKTQNNLFVGNNALSQGALTLKDGAILQASGGSIYVANNGTARGTVLVRDNATLFASGDSIYVGNNGGAKGTLTVQDGATLRTAGGNVFIGNNSGSTGAMYQTGGTLALASDFNIPRNQGAYGFFLRTAGSSTNTSHTQNGGGLGLIYLQGGSHAQVGGSLQIGNNVGGSATGVLWISGGTVTSTVDLTVGVSTGTRSEFTFSGGQIFAPNLRLNNNSNTLAFANLHTGLLQVATIFKQNALATNVVTLNGATLQARAAGNFLGAGATVLDNVYVQTGGVTIDNSGYALTVVPPLRAPPGQGVTAIALTNSGSGYIGAPHVLIAGGGGTGATAVAEIDVAAGTVTNLVITSPGVNYTTAPTVTLVGGGFSTPAGVGAATLTANGSGGVTLAGGGSIALLGTNTYAGATVISNGILLVGSTNSIPGTLILATNTAGIGPAYPIDQAFIDWLTTKIDVATSPGVLALGTNSANALNLTILTNWILGAAGGSQTFSGALTLPGTNVYLGGGNGNLIFVPSLVTGSNYFIGLPGVATGVVTFAGTNDAYASGIVVRGGTLRGGRANAFGSATATVTVLDGASLDVGGQNLGKVQVFVTGRGVGANGAIMNSGANATPGLQFVTLTGDATVGGPSRWDIRDAALGPKLDLAGYTLTKTNTSDLAVYNTTVTDGNILIGQGLFRFEQASTATTGVGTITVGPSGTLDFWTFGGSVTRSVIVTGGTVSVGSGTATVGSPFALVGPTNTFSPVVNATLIATNVVSGNGLLRKVGLGTLRINTSASHSGQQVVSLGTLQLSVNDPVNGAFPSSAGLLVNNGATVRFDFDYGLFGANTRPLTIGNGGHLSTAGGVSYHLDKPFTLAGGILTGGVPHATLGNWILQTNVPVTALSSITAPRSQLDVPGGVTFDVGAGGLTVSGTLEDPLGGTGSLVKAGSGTMTVTGTNTYQGATVVAAGTLKLAAFAPAGGASVWLDAGDDSTVTRDGGGLVSQWSDKSGQFRHALQTTNASRPLFVTNALLNRTVVRFGGAQTLNADLSFLANNGYSIFAVEGRTNNGNLYFLGTVGGGVNNQSLHFGYRSSNQFTLAQYGNDANTAVGQPAPYTTQQFRVWDGLFDFANQTIFLDGTNVATRVNAQPMLTTLGPGIVGAGYNGNNFQGDLAEILIYNRGVSSYERQQVEGYLRTKWLGVTPPALADLLPVNTALRLAAGTVFDLGGVSQTVGSLADHGVGGGNVTNTAALAVTLAAGGDNSDTVFSGVIGDGAGSVAFVKNGTGTLTLAGLNTYSGRTDVSNGTLLVQGALGTGLVNVDAGGTLGGTGLVAGTVSNDGGTVAPGASPGRLFILGDLAGAGTLAIEIAGASDYDTLLVGGAAVLMNGTLTVTTNGYAPVAGDTFTILTASNGVSGTFTTTNLPALSSPGMGWVVDYQANAIVLSVTGAPPATGYDLAATAITNGLSGYQDDADGDGYANLLEYVTGGSLTNPGTEARMNATRTNSLLALKFSRDTAATDATIYVEGSFTATNGANWLGIATNIGGSWGGATNVSESGPGPVSVTVQDPIAPATNRFLRLRVTRP